MSKENLTVKKVVVPKEGTHIHIDSVQGGCFGLDKKYGIIPKKGDTMVLYCVNGSIIRGIDLNGEKIFYKSDEELEQERKEWLENNEKEKQENFEKEKERMDKRYDALPKAFQERINKYRNNNPRFRVDYESYELFCCEQAIEIAKACKTPEKVKEFKSKSWDEQKEFVPTLSDGHSGNTFGAACSLAYWYLKEVDNVVMMPGSLATLVGSKEYGDIPKEEA